MRIIFFEFFLREISMQNIIQKIYALFEWVQSLNSLNSKTDCKKREQKLSWIFSTKSKLNLFNRHTYGTVQMSTSNVISIVWLSSIWTKMAKKKHACTLRYFLLSMTKTEFMALSFREFWSCEKKPSKRQNRA